MTKVIPGHLELVAKLKCTGKRSEVKDAAYADGFAAACDKHNVDPQVLLRMVDELELAL